MIHSFADFHKFDFCINEKLRSRWISKRSTEQNDIRLVIKLLTINVFFPRYVRNVNIVYKLIKCNNYRVKVSIISISKLEFLIKNRGGSHSFELHEMHV